MSQNVIESCFSNLSRESGIYSNFADWQQSKPTITHRKTSKIKFDNFDQIDFEN